jgi:hypothetical protein
LAWLSADFPTATPSVDHEAQPVVPVLRIDLALHIRIPVLGRSFLRRIWASEARYFARMSHAFDTPTSATPMSRAAIISIVVVVWIRAFVLADPPPATDKPNGIEDPRAAMIPVILFHHQKNHKDGLQGPLLIFARWDINPPNQILGIEGSFTDEQIISGLRKFYHKWRPPANELDRPPPEVIFAQQNWGCGAGLREPLEDLSIEFDLDVYQLYPVVTQIKSHPEHPTPNDKRLAELIKGE